MLPLYQLQCSTMLNGLTEPKGSPVEKRVRVGYPVHLQLCVNCWESPLWSAPTWIAWESTGFEHKKSDYSGKERTLTSALGLWQNKFILVVPKCPQQLCLPAEPSTHRPTREDGGVQICLTRVPKQKAFSSTGSRLFSFSLGAKSLLSRAEYSSQPYLNRRLTRLSSSCVVLKCLNREYIRQRWAST